MIFGIGRLRDMLKWGKIKITLSAYLPYFLIFLFIAIPLGWFKKGLVIASGDNYFYLDPSMMLPSFIYSWYERIQAGFVNNSIAEIFPFMTFWWFFKAIGVSLINIQRLWICSYFVLSGWSIYLLVIHFGKKLNFTNILILKTGGVLSAALYIVNVFVVIDLVQPSLRPVQAVLPFMLYLWIKGLESSSVKYAFLLALASLLCGSANVNMANTAIVFLILSIYLVFHLVFNRNNLASTIKFVMISGLLLILFNFWWLSSTLSSLLAVSNRVIEALASYNFLKVTSLQEAFRFMGFWAWKSTYEGVALVPYADKYDKLPIVLFTYIIPAFSFLVLLRKKSKEIVFLGVLSIIGLFLVKGAQPPFGDFFIFLYKNIPGFLAYREPFAKFTVINVLSISLLLGLSFTFITHELIGQRQNALRYKSGMVLSGVLFVSLLFMILKNAFPLLTNEAIWDKHHKVARSLFVKVPDYWRETREWFVHNNINDERIMVLPKSGYGHDYDWESGISTAGPVAHVLQSKPIIFYSSTPTMPSEDVIRSLYDGLSMVKNPNFINGLGMLNVRFLLQHNDLDWQDQLLGLTFSPREVVDILSKYPEISKIQTFGRLDIYELNKDFRKPKFYSSNWGVYSQLKTADLIKSNYPVSLNNCIIFEEGTITNEQRETIIGSSRYIFLNVNKDNNDKDYVSSPISLEYDVFSNDGQIGKVNLIKGKNLLTNNFPGNNLVLVGTRDNSFYVPDLKYNKISPVKYEVSTESKQPFYLIFSESFNPSWQAYINGVKLPESNHLIVNGFANSWLIDKSGKLKIDVVFSKQTELNISYLITIVSIIVSLIIIILKLPFKKNSKIL